MSNYPLWDINISNMEIIPACINCKHIKQQYGVLYCDVDKSRVEESDCCDGDNWNFESIFK